MQIKHYIWKP